MLLSIKEQTLFNALQEVANTIPDVTLRITGGWVRDTLMGKPNDDFDVMVDTMSGEAFARIFAKSLNCAEPVVFRANPEKSKHVETANLKFELNGMEFDVDFTMARKETYRRDSRVPDTVTMATPEEDAFRRDFTINAMFYNLRTGLVEDFTGLGRTDLFDRLIRAPGDPFVRFMEDPLRVMRAIRFCCRFDFSLECSTEVAMRQPEVQEALFHKVAVERIGDEFLTALHQSVHQEPLRVITIMKGLGILDHLVDDAIKGSIYEGKLLPWKMDQNNTHHQLNLWEHTMAACQCTRDPVLLLSLLFHDIGKRFPEVHRPNAAGTGYAGHEDHSAEIAELFFRHVKLDTLIPKVKPLIRHHMRPLHLLDSSDKALRRLLRDLEADGVDLGAYTNHILADVSGKSFALADCKEDLERTGAWFERLRKIADTPVAVPRNTCILNGNEIKKILGRTTDGPWIRDAKEWLLDLCDGEPSLTREEAMIRLKQHFGENP